MENFVRPLIAVVVHFTILFVLSYLLGKDPDDVVGWYVLGMIVGHEYDSDRH